MSATSKRTGWVEPSTTTEKASDPQSPYRMCFETGERFALSTLDAIRAQKQGLEFRPVCLNCGQWAHSGDCLNECETRGFAKHERMDTESEAK